MSVSDTIPKMLSELQNHCKLCVDNNVKHATTTSNAWRSSAEHIDRVCKCLNLLLMQAGASNLEVANMLQRHNAGSIVNTCLNQMQSMQLVFDTPSRQKLLKAAIAGIKELDTGVKEGLKHVVKGGGSAGASAGTSAGNAGLLVKPPAFQAPKGTMEGTGDPSQLRTGTNIKP